jgi:hypothetical protein
MVPMTVSELISREQAAAYLGVKPQTMASWATTQRYDLPYVKIGSLVRYRISDLARFVESRTVGGASSTQQPPVSTRSAGARKCPAPLATDTGLGVTLTVTHCSLRGHFRCALDAVAEDG